MAQDNTVPESFVELARPHVDSFDYFLEEGLQQIVEHLEPAEVRQLRQTCKTLFWPITSFSYVSLSALVRRSEWCRYMWVLQRGASVFGSRVQLSAGR